MSPSPNAPSTLERQHNHRLIELMRMHLSITSGLLDITNAYGPARRTPEELLDSSAIELNLSDEGPVVQRTARFRAPHPHPRVPAGLQVKFLVTHIIWADPSQSVMLETQMLFGNCFEHAVALPFADREQYLVMIEDYVDMRATGAVDLHPDCS